MTYLKSIKNMRDIGGLRAENGSRIRANCFLRGGSLAHLTPEDAEMLTHNYGVKYIVDLRTDDEAKKEPDVVPDGVEYLRLPLREDVFDMVERKEGESKWDFIKRIPTMPEIYKMMVTKESSVEALRKTFEVICNDVKPKNAIYVHCSEGKDRTEIVMGLLEYLLGVDEKTIEADYLVSNKAFAGRNRRLNFWLGIKFHHNDFFSEFRKMYEADSSMLAGAKEEIENTYGSMESFYRNTLGISEEMEAELKRRVLQN